MWYNEVRCGCCHLLYCPRLRKFWKRCGKVCRTICRTVHLHHIFWSWQRSLGDNNSIKLNVSVDTLRQRLCRGLYQNTVMQHPCCFIEVTHLVTEEPLCTSLHSGVYVRACVRVVGVAQWRYDWFVLNFSFLVVFLGWACQRNYPAWLVTASVMRQPTVALENCLGLRIVTSPPWRNCLWPILFFSL